MIRAGIQSTGSRNNRKKNGNGYALTSGIMIVLFVSLIVSFYYYLSNRQKQQESPDAQRTVAQELIARNLERNYPPTPKEVIRYYSDITKCFYNEEYSDSELEQLADKARMLFDEELAENNEWGQYIIELENDIEYFKSNSIRISTYTLSASTDVEEFSEDGYDFARLYCTYTLTKGSTKQLVEEVYLLRKDEDGHWRIFGWTLAENVAFEE